MPASIASMRQAFMDAVAFQGPVEGLTHSLYKYPARFSPIFARCAIEAFTEEGGVVLDPFCGGGTTLVEGRLARRSVYGSDISSLAVFLTRAKVVRLSTADLADIDSWFWAAFERMNIHRRSEPLSETEFAGYDKNMPWQLRKLCEQYLEGVDQLTKARQRRFARCVLLRCGQWALDCRNRIPSAEEFRQTLAETYHDAVQAVSEYRRCLDTSIRGSSFEVHCRCVQASAATVSASDLGKTFSGADLLLTSPPYPGVHVLYHRWNVRTRRETPAPFWIANCRDGHGCVHYTLGHRRQERLADYYAGVTECFGNLRPLLRKDALTIQLVAFSAQDWQLPAYLNAMSEAGYREVLPRDLDLKPRGRLWRSVPGRRWYSQIRGKVPSSREVVLFHRPT